MTKGEVIVKHLPFSQKIQRPQRPLQKSPLDLLYSSCYYTDVELKQPLNFSSLVNMKDGGR